MVHYIALSPSHFTDFYPPQFSLTLIFHILVDSSATFPHPSLPTHTHYNLFTVHLHVSYFLAKSFIVHCIYQAARSSSRPSNVTYISSTCDIKLSFLTWRIQSCIYMYVQLGYLFILAIVDIHVQKLLYSWEVYSILCLYWNMVIPQSLKSANILAVSMWDNILQT